jgi:signal transduction histidine kinase
LWILVGALAVAVTVVATWQAVHALRSFRFPSLLVDPYAVFSEVYLPSWGTAALGISHSDRVIAVGGAPVGGRVAYGDLPGQRLYRRVAALPPETTAVEIALDRPGAPRVTCAVRRLGAADVGLFFVAYAIVGWFVLWSGMLVLVLGGRRAGSASYVFWSVGSFLFFITFLDYQTTMRLTPLFSTATVWITFGFAWLGFAFPEPPVRGRWALALALVALGLLCALSVGTLIAAPWLGYDARFVRVAIDHVLPMTMALPALSVGLRLRGATGRSRAELRSALFGLALIPIVVGLFFLATIATGAFTTGRGWFHLVLPLAAPLMPLSIGYALIRHNILATTAILSIRMLMVPVLLLATVGAMVAWFSVQHFIEKNGVPSLAALILSLAVFAALVVAGRQLSLRMFLPARSQFRPTIEQLSDQLSVLRSRGEILAAVERVVTRWLPARAVRVLEPKDLATIEPLPLDGQAQLAEGKRVWTADSPWQRRLLVPMRSRGEIRGVLLAAPKHQAALYTNEDLILLDTIASLAGVALHNVDVVAQLESLRRLEVDATRGEKLLALNLLAAEISHEIAYPLNFFRYLLKQGSSGQGLDEQDVEIGREEVDRLERMLTTLRRLQQPPQRLERVAVLATLQRALELLREPIAQQAITLTIEVPATVTVLADKDKLLQVFANLLRNAVQAVGSAGAVGVRTDEAPAGLTIEVWDTGPGVSEALGAAIFDPFVSGRSGGSGLGLAITQRIVRSFGWTLSFERRQARTAFLLHVPSGGDAMSPPNLGGVP